MSDEAAKNAPLGAACDEDVEEIRKALDYWRMLDFLSKDSLPDELEGNEKELQKGRIDRFVPSYKDVADKERTLISLVEKRLDRIVSKEDRGKITGKEVFVHLGKFPREKLVEYLFRNVEHEHVEKKKTGKMAAAILGLTSEGLVSSFELSPLLWLTKNDHAGLHIKQYKDCSSQITERLQKEYTGPLTISEVGKIVESEIVGAYLRDIERYLRDSKEASGAQEGAPLGFDGGRSTGVEAGIEWDAAAMLFDYHVFTESEKAYTVSYESYFTEDIGTLSDCFESVTELDDFNVESLKLVAQYLGAGLRGRAEDRRKQRRKCVLPKRGSNGEECLRAYREKMGYGSMPLGRWPSKYVLSFMQQVGVNLVAGRDVQSGHNEDSQREGGDEWDEPRARYEAPQRIWSVNGPPGTGKTTLLKDIVAANVVEKARLLCEYENPDEAFERVKLPRKSTGYLHYARGVYRLKDERINDLGIIVCSSNNNAVENISKELPKAEGLFAGIEEDERTSFLDEGDDLSKVEWSPSGEYAGAPAWKRDLYFSFPAYNQFRKKRPDDSGSRSDGKDDYQVDLDHYLDCDNNLDLLLAARLGKTENINAFRDGPLDKLYWNWPKCDATKPGERYGLARKAFLAQYEKVKGMLSVPAKYEELEIKRQQACDELTKQESAYRKLRSDASGRLEEIADRYCFHVPEEWSVDDLRSLREHLTCTEGSYQDKADRLEDAVAAAEKERDKFDKGLSKLLRRSYWENAKKELDKAKEERNKQEGELKGNINACSEANEEVLGILGKWRGPDKKCKDISKRIKQLDSELSDLEREFSDNRDDATEERAHLVGLDYAGTGAQFARDSDSEPRLRPTCIDKEFVAGLVSENDDVRREAHHFNPISNPEILHERDLLFIMALRVTREFILKSKHMKSNLRYLMAYWGKPDVLKGKQKDRQRIEFDQLDKTAMAPVLFQALNLLTPVISTTFASVHRLFSDVSITRREGPAPFGLLIVDEAGQASPYFALGALARSRAAMAVGDPYQVEPVTPGQAEDLYLVLADGIGPLYMENSASVQRLADEANPYGKRRDDGSWVGCPLVVHRRCISPMFDISNEIAYQGDMLNETRSLNPDIPADNEKLERFYMPSSQWLNVAGSERGKKDHYVEAQGKRVVEIVIHAFMKKPDGPSLFVISPFTTVIEGVKGALGGNKPAGVSDKAWDAFLENNIGTVHTFQGKEADEVVFVLGCDKSAPGAVAFVGLNIVNVAASRAKHRLYVVGDYNVWKRNDYIVQMKRILDTAWLKHWKAYQETHDPKELRLAYEMQPLPESIPFVDTDELDADDAENACEADEPADEFPFHDTSVCIENVDREMRRLGLDEEGLQKGSKHDGYYQFYGFATVEDLEKALFDSLEPPAEDRKRILDNLRETVVYYIPQSDRPSHESSRRDFRASLIYLVNAADLYLEVCTPPLLKQDSSKPAKKGKAKSPSVGEYAKRIRANKERLAWMTGLGFGTDGNDISVPGGSTKWWADLAKNIDGFAERRNDLCHAGRRKPIDLDCFNAALGCLFQTDADGKESFAAKDHEGANSSPISTPAERCPIREPLILNEGDVFAAVLRGMTIEAALPPGLGEPERGETGEAVDMQGARLYLRDVQSVGETDGCSSYGRLRANKFCDLSYTSRQVLGFLRVDGYIEDGIFEQAEGPFPTERGCEVGIKWRRYENGDSAAGAGIVFSEAGQEWLVSYLHERADGSDCGGNC